MALLYHRDQVCSALT